MWLIAATSPPPALQMATKYHPISVLETSGKSLRKFLTFPDLPRTISGNFYFRLFEHIFHFCAFISAIEMTFHGNPRRAKICGANRKVFYVQKKVNDSMQNVFAQPGFVFYCQIHYFAIDAQKNLGGGAKIWKKTIKNRRQQFQ